MSYCKQTMLLISEQVDDHAAGHIKAAIALIDELEKASIADRLTNETAHNTINELAATVDRLTKAADRLAYEIAHHPSETDFKSFGPMMDVMNETPQQSLAEHDAEVAKKAILAAIEDYNREYCGQGVTRWLDAFSVDYAKRVKRGE